MTEEAVKIANLERDLVDKQATVERLNTEVSDKSDEVSGLEETVERLNSDAETKDAKIAKLEEQITEYANSEANAKWDAMKASRIPKGMVATPEAEAELRELYNTDKDAFYGKIMDVQRPAETERQGTEFNNTEDSRPSGVGNFNPNTGKWE